MKKKKNIIICIICLLVLITLIKIPKIFINNKEDILPEVKLKNIENNKMFAIMVPDINGKGYIPYDGDKWPTDENDYFYSHSECVDNKGEKIENAIEYNEKENTALLDTNQTVYCTLYFDKYPYMKVITKDIQIDSYIEKAPVYMSTKVKHIKFVNYIKDGLNSNEENTNWWDLSDIEQGTPKGSVIAWLEPIDNNYDRLYIGSKNKIRAISLRDAFKNGGYDKETWEDNLEDIDFNNMLDTSKTTTLYGMFASDNKLLTITGGIEDWDVSNVTTMGRMFENCTNISNLDFLSNWNTQKLSGMEIMLANCSSLTNLNFFKNWSISNVSVMNGVFGGCTNLRDINGLKSWDVSNVINMSMLFSGCNNLNDVNPIQNWNTPHVINMNNMFRSCTSLQTVNLSSWKTFNVTDLWGMFVYCNNLISVNLSIWNTENVANVTWMFAGCTSLQTIDMRNATFTQIKDSTNYQNMFSGVSSSVTITVKDEDQRDWIINNKVNLQFTGLDENIKLPTEL